MPIYEYQCNNCEYQFEKLQRMSDDLLKTCPDCDQDELRKLISSTGFQLKGAGWYVTDFKGDNKNNTKSEGASKTESVKNKIEKTTILSKEKS